MTMQELTRYERAALAIHTAGERVTHERIDDWLRAHDGRGCSPREALPLVQRYRRKALERVTMAVEASEKALHPLAGWERAAALLELRKRYGRATR
jgi:hypothetical protein